MTRAAVATLLCAAWAATLGMGGDGPPACEPGYTLVAETCYREELRRCCKLVPEVKKVTRVVYACEEEYGCAPRCRIPGLCAKKGCCETAPCPTCADVVRKRKLVKKLIVEEKAGHKWVVEMQVERVPHTVYRKVPCASK
jgi:hypothetical protein